MRLPHVGRRGPGGMRVPLGPARHSPSVVRWTIRHSTLRLGLSHDRCRHGRVRQCGPRLRRGCAHTLVSERRMLAGEWPKGGGLDPSTGERTSRKSSESSRECARVSPYSSSEQRRCARPQCERGRAQGSQRCSHRGRRPGKWSSASLFLRVDESFPRTMCATLSAKAGEAVTGLAHFRRANPAPRLDYKS